MDVRAVIAICLCVGTARAADAPQLSTDGIENAADHSRGHVAPGEIVILHPSNAGPATLAGAQLDHNGRVTTALAETRVLFDGIAAPMSFSARGELGAVVPYEIGRRGSTEVVVEYQGVRSEPVKLAVVASAPALFTLDSTGQGQAGMLNATGCCNSPRNPATRGSIVALYATGEGETTPRGITGSVSAYSKIARYPVPRRPLKVLVGNQSAEIIYAGEAPHAVAGLLQVNFRVPANAPLGDRIPLVLMIGNTRSPDGVTMAIRSTVQRVVVIDPELSTQNWTRRVLRTAGYEVSTFADSSVAAAQAASNSIDLIIVSLAIPAGERQHAIEALRANRPRLRIIATAGSLDPEVLRDADMMGAQAVVAKPLSARILLRRVSTILSARPMPYVANEERRAFYSIRGMPH